MRVRLRFKIPIATILLTIVSMTVVAVFSWKAASIEIEETAYTKLLIVAHDHADTLAAKFRQASVDLGNLAADTAVNSNTEDLIENFDPAQREFPIIAETFSATPGEGDRSAIMDTIRPTVYGRRHRRLHAPIRQLLGTIGYADIIILDKIGRIIYTARKDKDFGHNVAEPNFAVTGLLRILERLRKAPEGTRVFEDYADYPVGSERSAFIGTPILRRANVAMGTSQDVTHAGYLVIRLATSFVTAAPETNPGLGLSGELLVFGRNRQLRGMPRHAEFGANEIAAVARVLKSARSADDISMVMTEVGQPTLAAITPVTIMGDVWSVVAIQARSEALASLHRLLMMLMVIVGLVAVVSTIAALYVVNRFVRPLTQLTAALQQLSYKNIIAEIPGVRRTDEIGEIARAVLLIRDITSEQANATAELYRRLNDENHRLANSDPLTHLLNRRGFFLAVERNDTTGRQTERAILLMDLDGFKPVNDLYGHAAGDRVLTEVANRIKAVLPPNIPIARLGGDEFVVYFEDVPEFFVQLAADRIIETIKQPIDIGIERVLTIGISIGLCCHTNTLTSIVTMVECADAALYEAKNEGRNRWRQHLARRGELAPPFALSA